MAVSSIEAVIDYEFLRGRQNETIVKELCVASAIASEMLRFKSPYKMADHGSIENGINWSDGHIEYKELHTVLNEARGRFRPPLRICYLEMHVPRRTDWPADP